MILFAAISFLPMMYAFGFLAFFARALSVASPIPAVPPAKTETMPVVLACSEALEEWTAESLTMAARQVS